MGSEHAVRAILNYTLDDGFVPEAYFYEPPPGTIVHKPRIDPRDLPIFDAWPQAERFSLDRHGFTLREFRSGFDGFDRDDTVRRDFYPIVAEFVRGAIEARHVIVFDHTFRCKINEGRQTAERTITQRSPVMSVHCDYTLASGPLRVRQLLPQESEALLRRRVAFYNVWIPVRRTVEEKPLAMCDATSTSQDDMLKMVLRYRERTGEIYLMRHSAEHKWWYFPKMTPEHALLLKTYDSEADGRARFLGHSAFDDPESPPDASMRESIEIRTMAFF